MAAGDGPTMGERTVTQEALFYGISLDQHVSEDHLLRSIQIVASGSSGVDRRYR